MVHDGLWGIGRERSENETLRVKDQILPFRIENTDIRGQIVRLGPTLDDVLNRHDYPGPVAQIVGQALLLTAMLGASLKFDGKLTLQIQGDGPLSMVIADYQTSGTLRGVAHSNKDALDQLLAGNAAAPDQSGFSALLGKGHLAFTVDQGPDMERYQGIVALGGPDLSACALVYFGQSEQILTAVKLSVSELLEPGGVHSWHGGGLLIQLLPPKGGERNEVSNDALDDWERMSILMETVEDLELTDPDLSAQKLLYRLFHEDGVRIFDAQDISFSCQCNKEKIKRILKTFDADDQKGMIEEGMITARCDFCNTQYTFNPSEISS